MCIGTAGPKRIWDILTALLILHDYDYKMIFNPRTYQYTVLSTHQISLIPPGAAIAVLASRFHGDFTYYQKFQHTPLNLYQEAMKKFIS